MSIADGLMADELRKRLADLEAQLAGDVLTIVSPIVAGLEHVVRKAVEATPSANRQHRLAVILQTGGGLIEIVGRMVQVLRANYGEVVFVIPDAAMSAGTVFAMSGDDIYMDSFSVLGPIDPQVAKKINGETRLVPALAYLAQYDRLVAKSMRGELSTAEYALLQTFDLGELQQFEEAQELSVDLLKKWLTRYKFKNWTATANRQQPVTLSMKEARAEEIARALSNHRRWHSHGRGISMEVLRADPPDGLNLRITDFGADQLLAESVRCYYECVSEYVGAKKYSTFVHARGYF